MLKRRDPVAIGNVGNYTKNMSEELQVALTKLIEDIKSITEDYKGTDADTEIYKFLETADKIKKVIRNYEYYGNYMRIVSDKDSENLDRTKKSFETQKSQPTMIEENPAIQTLSLNTINVYNEGED